MDKQEFMDEFCRRVKANIQEAIDQFGGPELDEADLSFEDWIEATIEDNETPASLCYCIL